MRHASLTMSYHGGKFEAAYLYFPRRPGDKSVRTERPADGLVVDYAADGRAIGIEILSKSKTCLESLNRVLKSMHHEPLGEEDLRPLLAAG